MVALPGCLNSTHPYAKHSFTALPAAPNADHLCQPHALPAVPVCGRAAPPFADDVSRGPWLTQGARLVARDSRLVRDLLHEIPDFPARRAARRCTWVGVAGGSAATPQACKVRARGAAESTTCCAHPFVRLCNPPGTLHASPIALSWSAVFSCPHLNSQAAAPPSTSTDACSPLTAAGCCSYLASGSQAAATTRDMILAHPINIEELAKLGKIRGMRRMVIALEHVYCISGTFSADLCSQDLLPSRPGVAGVGVPLQLCTPGGAGSRHHLGALQASFVVPNHAGPRGIVKGPKADGIMLLPCSCHRGATAAFAHARPLTPPLDFMLLCISLQLPAGEGDAGGAGPATGGERGDIGRGHNLGAFLSEFFCFKVQGLWCLWMEGTAWVRCFCGCVRYQILAHQPHSKAGCVQVRVCGYSDHLSNSVWASLRKDGGLGIATFCCKRA